MRNPVQLFINLYRDDGIPLSCHLSLVNLHTSPTSTLSNTCVNQERISIITIRSASSIGNANFCNIGINSLTNFSKEAREEAICKV